MGLHRLETGLGYKWEMKIRKDSLKSFPLHHRAIECLYCFQGALTFMTSFDPWNKNSSSHRQEKWEAGEFSDLPSGSIRIFIDVCSESIWVRSVKSSQSRKNGSPPPNTWRVWIHLHMSTHSEMSNMNVSVPGSVALSSCHNSII